MWLGGTAEGTTASEREVSESICAGSNESWLCGSLCARRRWVLCQVVGISGSDVALNFEQCVGEECLHLFNLRFLGFSEEAKAGARHCRPTSTNNSTNTPTPHAVTSSLRLRGSGTKKGKKIATRTPTRETLIDTLDTADDDDETPDDSSTLHPDIDAVGSSSDHASTISPSLPVHAPVPTTPLDTSAGTHDPPPTAPDLKDLRAATDAVKAATDAHRTAIYDLGTNLHVLSDEFHQFRSDQRARDQHLTLQLESNARAQSAKDDASRAELSSSLRLFTETQETKINEMKTLFSNALLKIQGIASGDPDNLAQRPPTPGAQGLTQPLVGAGADYLHGVHAQLLTGSSEYGAVMRAIMRVLRISLRSRVLVGDGSGAR